MRYNIFNMRFFLSLLFISVFSHSSFAQFPVFKIAYQISLNQELMDELNSPDMDENDEELASLKAILAETEKGGFAIQVWSAKDKFRVNSSMAEDFVQIVDKTTKKIYHLNLSDSTFMQSDGAGPLFGEEAAEDKFQIEFVAGNTETIAGYPCKLAIISPTIDDLAALGDEEIPSIQVWYTENIPAYTFGAFDFLGNLPGAALKVDLSGVQFVAKSITKEQVSTDFFAPPVGFQESAGDLGMEEGEDMELGEDMIAYYDTTSGLYGLKNVNDEILTQPLFTSLSEVRDGIIVAVNSEYQAGFLNLQGKTVLPLTYESIVYDDVLGAYQFSKDGKFGIMDKTGKNLWGKTYDFLSTFEGNHAIFMENEKSGILNKSGQIIIPATHESILQYDEHYFVVLDGEKFKIFDLKSNKMILDGFQELYLANTPNLFIASNDGEKYGFVNEKGTTVIPFVYSMVSPFFDGTASVVKLGEEETIQINTKGEEVPVNE